MNKAQIINEFLKERGSNGGKSTLKKYGKDHYKKMQAKSVKSKKRNKKRLVDKSPLQPTS